MTFHTMALIKLQARAGESETPERQQVERELIAEADRVVAFSPHERDSMIRLYGGDPQRITLAPVAWTSPGSGPWNGRRPGCGWD